MALLYHEAMYLPKEKRPDSWQSQPLDLIVDRNRHGMTGTIHFDFVGTNARIKEAG